MLTYAGLFTANITLVSHIAIRSVPNIFCKMKLSFTAHCK